MILPSTFIILKRAAETLSLRSYVSSENMLELHEANLMIFYLKLCKWHQLLANQWPSECHKTEELPIIKMYRSRYFLNWQRCLWFPCLLSRLNADTCPEGWGQGCLPFQMTCNKFWQGSNPSFQPITLRGQIVSTSVSTEFFFTEKKTQPLDISGM